MQDMFVCLLKQQLVEEVYPADMAGLSFEIEFSDQGFILKVYGFHDKLPVSNIFIVIFFYSYT